MGYINIRFGGKGHYQIKRWFDMKKGNYIIAMIRPATICGIGEIIRKRYHEENENFKIEIEGYDNPGEFWFFNRIDVDWITSPDIYIKVPSPSKFKREYDTYGKSSR